jgi:hypothetical protein
MIQSGGRITLTAVWLACLLAPVSSQIAGGSVAVLDAGGRQHLARPQGSDGPRRIEFRRGSSTAVVNGEVRAKAEVAYLLRARKGQRYSIRLKRTGPDTWFDLRDPDGEGVPEAEFDANLSLSGRFEKDGDYRIIVTALSQDSRFTLTVRVR